MNTPRMKEAWESSSRTADGFYSTTTPMSVFARSCYEEGCKLENELATVTAQRDRLAELHNKNAIHFNELLELCGTLRKGRDRLAEALRSVIDEDGTPMSINLANEVLQSLTTNEPISQ